jgi:hypothetical protein
MSLSSLYHCENSVQHRRVDKDAIREVLAQYLEERVKRDAGGVGLRFAAMTGIAQPDVANVLNRKKGRLMTWEMIVRIADALGPSVPDILRVLADRMERVVQAPAQPQPSAPASATAPSEPQKRWTIEDAPREEAPKESLAKRRARISGGLPGRRRPGDATAKSAPVQPAQPREQSPSKNPQK